MDLTLTSDVDRQGGTYDDKDDGTVAGRYQQLVTTRDPFLQRARDCAKVTIPSLVPDSHMGDHGRLKTPYQSIGARGLSNLANKLSLIHI